MTDLIDMVKLFILLFFVVGVPLILRLSFDYSLSHGNKQQRR